MHVRRKTSASIGNADHDFRVRPPVSQTHDSFRWGCRSAWCPKLERIGGDGAGLARRMDNQAPPRRSPRCVRTDAPAGERERRWQTGGERDRTDARASSRSFDRAAAPLGWPMTASPQRLNRDRSLAGIGRAERSRSATLLRVCRISARASASDDRPGTEAQQRGMTVKKPLRWSVAPRAETALPRDLLASSPLSVLGGDGSDP